MKHKPDQTILFAKLLSFIRYFQCNTRLLKIQNKSQSINTKLKIALLQDGRHLNWNRFKTNFNLKEILDENASNIHYYFKH